MYDVAGETQPQHEFIRTSQDQCTCMSAQTIILYKKYFCSLAERISFDVSSRLNCTDLNKRGARYRLKYCH